MNRRETGEVLVQLSAAFRADMDDVATEVWARELADVVPVDGIEATRALIRHNRFMPTIAEFLDCVRTAARERIGDRPALPEGRADQPTAERIRAIIVEAKAKVASKGEHRHGGPSPCPVCGGMNPDVARPKEGAA